MFSPCVWLYKSRVLVVENLRRIKSMCVCFIYEFRSLPLSWTLLTSYEATCICPKPFTIASALNQLVDVICIVHCLLKENCLSEEQGKSEPTASYTIRWLRN